MDEDPVVLKRDEAYIGVLIDDLVNKGTDEPYRMFTSRAEYRILLRQDNSDLRLTEKAYKLGLATEERYQRTQTKRDHIDEIKHLLKTVSISPDQANGFLESIGQSGLKQKIKVKDILTRPKVNLHNLVELVPELEQGLNAYSTEEKEQAEIQLKYQGYIRKERELADKMVRLDDINLPSGFDYHRIKALSFEGREKLSKVKPESLGQASRISGVTPADISVLMVYIGR